MGELICRPANAVTGWPGAFAARWPAILMAALLLAVPARELQAQSASGEAVAVSGSVSANGPVGVRALVTGGPVYMGDTIDTGLAGEAQIVFTDETRLAVGPGSRMVIDEYVLQTRSTVSSFAIGAARGAFRFISGGSRSNAYQVTTPTATIGIRGTGFDFSARTPQRTNTLLYDGRITTCNLAGQCINLDRSCEVSVILADPAEPLRRSDTGDLVPGSIRFQFPYLVDEARLLPQFRVQAARCLGNGGRSDTTHDAGNIDRAEPDRPDQHGEDTAEPDIGEPDIGEPDVSEPNISETDPGFNDPGAGQARGNL